MAEGCKAGLAWAVIGLGLAVGATSATGQVVTTERDTKLTGPRGRTIERDIRVQRGPGYIDRRVEIKRAGETLVRDTRVQAGPRPIGPPLAFGGPRYYGGPRFVENVIVQRPAAFGAFIGLPALSFAFGSPPPPPPPPVVVVPEPIYGASPPPPPQQPPAFDAFADAIGRLKSFHASSRRDGALTLGRIGDPRSVPALNERLEHDFDKDVRVASAWALGEIGDERGAVPLERAALSDKRHEVRDAAGLAFRKLPRPGESVQARPTGPTPVPPQATAPQLPSSKVIQSRPEVLDPGPGPIAPSLPDTPPPPAGPREPPGASGPVLIPTGRGGPPSMAANSPDSPDPPGASGFGLATATFVIVSSMIGVGVLTTSGHTVLKLGSNQLMLALWAVGGLVALCGALTLAELSAALPRSGGEYVIFREAYGPLPAFLAGWVSFQFGFSAPIAATASAASSYLLAPLGLDPQTAAILRPATASLAIVGFAAVHCSGPARSVRLQGVVTVLELAFLVAFAAAGLVAGRGNYANLHDRPPVDSRTMVDLLFALVYISYGYTGWNAASYLAGEIGDAPRRLPRAILLGTGLVTALYLALNLVYALALPAAEIRALARAGTGKADAVDPIAQLAAARLFGPRWAEWLSVGVGLILLSTLSAYLLTGPRVTFAMARAGQFPPIAGRVSARTGAPVVATLLQAGWGLALLWTGSFDQIVLYAGVGLSTASMLSVGAVYVLRIRQPDLPRPFRVPGYPWVPAVYLVATAALLVAVTAEQPAIAAVSALSIAAGLPIHALMPRGPEDPARH